MTRPTTGTVVDFMAQPSTHHEPTDEQHIPERFVGADEFNAAALHWGGFVEAYGPLRFLTGRDETLIYDTTTDVA